ncbi:MAG TPA: CDP-alcohol phosphatidyltransferase family protein [Acidimicrobiales bacterium]|nr:CDP-alcohol phosphatidyltransferase family protein [Acidimicrobiales bacterium]
MAADGEDRILTIPNVISVVRLLMIPVFLYLLFGRDNRAGAAGLLAGLGATDWVDGYIARHFNQTSTIGKILDPTADRLMLLVSVAAIIIDGAIPTVVAVLVLFREGAVAIAALVLAALGARRIDVTWYGKAGTFGLMFAIPFFLTAESTIGWRDTAWILAWVCVVPGLVFGYIAALQYIPLGRRALAEGRVGSPA